MADSTLSFSILAKDNASSTITKVGQRFGALHLSVGKVAKGIAMVGPALAGLAVGAGLKQFVDDARESAKVGRLTEQVIKSTGGAAKLTADQVGALATAISNKTGADDEAIQSGQNLLLTFTNIRNGVGKGNDIFNQASQAITDMTAAMNGGEVTADGMKTSSIQLGKALNDPVKGVTALSKVGVSFTEQQKKQIKTLVDSGKTMQAQKIILGELSKEFGGAAAAAADPVTKLKTIVGNASEAIGGALLPIVDKGATILGRVIPAAVSKAGMGLHALGEAFKGEGVTSTGFVGVMERIGVVARSVFDTFQTSVLPRLKEFGGFITGTILPKLGEFAGFIKNQFVTYVIPAVQNLVAVFKPLVIEVGTALVGAFKKIEPPVASLGTTIAKDVGPALKSFTGFLKDNGTIVRSVAVGVGAIVGAILLYKGVLGVVSIATKAFAAVQAILNAVLSANPIGIVVLALVGLAAGLVYAYKHSEKFRDIVNKVFGAVRDTAVSVFKAVVGAVKTAIDWVKGNWPLLLAVLTGPIGLAVLVIAKHWEAIKSGARTAIAFVVDKFLGFVGAMISGAAKAFGWVPGLGPKLKTAAAEFAKFRDAVNAKLSGIQDQQINFSIKYTNTGVNLSTPSSVGRRARGGPGGPVSGPGSTTSDGAGLYALSNKEWVIKAASSMKYGDRAMASVNDGTAVVIPGLAAGGKAGLGTRLIADSSGLAKSVKAVVVAAASSAAKAIARTGGGLAGTMAFGRSQAGKPYIWGAAGPNGYDCSGFVGALINYARGRNPYRRLGSTESMPWSDLASGTGRFMVGWFKGNPGHTAATINGVNFESRGGRGVVVGSAARGAYDGLFNRRAKVRGFAQGGKVGDLPFDLLDPRGKDYQGQFRFPQYRQGTPWVPNDQLAYLHRGEQVIPAGANRGALRIEIAAGDSSPYTEFLVRELRKHIRVNGGDVQEVLGRR